MGRRVSRKIQPFRGVAIKESVSGIGFLEHFNKVRCDTLLYFHNEAKAAINYFVAELFDYPPVCCKKGIYINVVDVLAHKMRNDFCKFEYFQVSLNFKTQMKSVTSIWTQGDNGVPHSKIEQESTKWRELLTRSRRTTHS
jgi:hypothetical protein